MFKELPEDIQQELTHQRNQRYSSNLPPDFQPTVKSPVKVFSNKSPVKLFSKKRQRQIDQHSISTPTKKISLTNQQSPRSSRQKTIAMTVTITPTVRTSPSKGMSNKNDTNGFISPTQVNFDVLSELPAEIRNEVLTEFKKSQRYLTGKKTKNIIDSMSTPKENTSHRKHESTSQNNNTTLSTILSPSQLDQSVLNALPEEIRNEVLQDVRPTKRKRTDIDKRFDPGNNNGGHESSFPRVELFSRGTELGTTVVSEEKRLRFISFQSSSLKTHEQQNHKASAQVKQNL